jgi:predicted DNA binding protein
MYEAAFGLEHDSLYARITDGLDARVRMWCNNHCDLLDVTGAEAEAVVENLRAEVATRGTVRGDDRIVLVTDDCLLRHEENLLEAYLERHRCLSLPPRAYEDGRTTARVIALDEATLSAIYRDLRADHEVTVEAKRGASEITADAPVMVTDGVFPDLTGRQEEAIVAAHGAGYYEIPRDCTTADVAETMGVERRTAEEHLRIAERKLVDGFVTYLSTVA